MLTFILFVTYSYRLKKVVKIECIDKCASKLKFCKFTDKMNIFSFIMKALGIFICIVNKNMLWY